MNIYEGQGLTTHVQAKNLQQGHVLSGGLLDGFEVSWVDAKKGPTSGVRIEAHYPRTTATVKLTLPETLMVEILRHPPEGKSAPTSPDVSLGGMVNGVIMDLEKLRNTRYNAGMDPTMVLIDITEKLAAVVEGLVNG